ncbi:ferritin-like domain-containing protein [Streptomyces levis]|uniref:ferritin-like domain-containing protein n=1 Tax=Streptomyces levis TaxID=285566 RepID=UPI003C7E92A7
MSLSPDASALPGPPDVPTVRARLVEYLCEAAELEHSLCLQYLYAAFSLRANPPEDGLDDVQIETIREWKGQLLRLSREEMLHLGLVLNLLAAVGGAPYLQRPNFPQPERYYPLGVVSSLTPFSRATVDRFLAYEMPTVLLSEVNGAYGPDGRQMTVGMLYERIRELCLSVPEKELFIGPSHRQIDTAAVIDPDHVFDDDVLVGYGVEPFPVDSHASAMRAIDLIIEQGEGATEDAEDSHYGRLLRIRAQYDREERAAKASGRVFEPARPMLENPAVRAVPDAVGTGLITEPLTREAAELFNSGYGLMVLMLLRLYGRAGESRAELRTLQSVVFFPLMTMFVRPLGELLTELPAEAGDPARTAGPPFEFGRGIQLIPERSIAQRVFLERLRDLARRAQRVADLAGATAAPARIVRRLEFLAENVQRLAGQYAVDTGEPGTPHSPASPLPEGAPRGA